MSCSMHIGVGKTFVSPEEARHTMACVAWRKHSLIGHLHSQLSAALAAQYHHLAVCVWLSCHLGARQQSAHAAEFDNHCAQSPHVGSMRHKYRCCPSSLYVPGHQDADLSLTCHWTHALLWEALLIRTSWAHAAQQSCYFKAIIAGAHACKGKEQEQ